MAKTRPYLLEIKGEQRMIEAGSIALAVQHAFQAQITEARPARAAEVTAWVRANKSIETAGEEAVVDASEAAQAAATVLSGPVTVNSGPLRDVAPDSPLAKLFDEAIDPDRPEFDHLDALVWLQEDPDFRNSAIACAAWDEIVATGKMNLAQFDEVRGAAPAFADACTLLLQDDSDITLDQVRETLEDAPATLDEVVDAVAEWKRRENYVTGDAPADPDDVTEEPRDNGGVVTNGLE